MQKLKQLRTNLLEFFSLKNVFSLRNIAVMGMMIAVAAVLRRFTIYITPNMQGITFSYLPGAMVAMLCGPWAGLAFGLVSDVVMYLSNPQAFYFFGYALSEMLTCFIYACFLYRKPVKVWRVAAALAIITIFILFGLNFVWNSMMYGMAAGKFFTAARILNRLVQFPFHVFLITVVGRALQRNKRRIVQM